jgi:hypothetical protein
MDPKPNQILDGPCVPSTTEQESTLVKNNQDEDDQAMSAVQVDENVTTGSNDNNSVSGMIRGVIRSWTSHWMVGRLPFSMTMAVKTSTKVGHN